eukprot:scaffold334_cov363-Pavlova_lutheri.AAC.2
MRRAWPPQAAPPRERRRRRGCAAASPTRPRRARRPCRAPRSRRESSRPRRTADRAATMPSTRGRSARSARASRAAPPASTGKSRRRAATSCRRSARRRPSRRANTDRASRGGPASASAPRPPRSFAAAATERPRSERGTPLNGLPVRVGADGHLEGRVEGAAVGQQRGGDARGRAHDDRVPIRAHGGDDGALDERLARAARRVAKVQPVAHAAQRRVDDRAVERALLAGLGHRRARRRRARSLLGAIVALRARELAPARPGRRARRAQTGHRRERRRALALVGHVQPRGVERVGPGGHAVRGEGVRAGLRPLLGALREHDPAHVPLGAKHRAREPRVDAVELRGDGADVLVPDLVDRFAIRGVQDGDCARAVTPRRRSAASRRSAIRAPRRSGRTTTRRDAGRRHAVEAPCCRAAMLRGAAAF